MVVYNLTDYLLQKGGTLGMFLIGCSKKISSLLKEVRSNCAHNIGKIIHSRDTGSENNSHLCIIISSSGASYGEGAGDVT